MKKNRYLIFTVQIVVLIAIVLSCFLLIIIVQGQPGSLRQNLSNIPIFSNIIKQNDTSRHRSKLRLLDLYMPPFEPLAAIIQSDSDDPVQCKDKYIRYYNQVIQVFPKQGLAYGMLGYCYYQEGENSLAIDHYVKAIKFNAVNFWHYFNLALIMRQEGRMIDSVPLLKLAVRIKPEYTLKTIVLSPFYRQIRSASNFNYNIVESLQKGHGQANLLLGLYYQSIGKKDEAEQFFLKVREINPDYIIEDVNDVKLRIF